MCEVLNVHGNAGVHCLANVSGEKVMMIIFFFFVNDFESIFNHSCSPTIQYHIGPSLRDHLPCISALLRTIEVRLQERPTTQTFSAHWGCF